MEKLDAGGRVYAWGSDEFGQLGNGDTETENKNAPVKVLKPDDSELTDIVYIDAGYEHSLAIDIDGNIWVWGRNSEAELGLGEDYYPENQPYAKKL